ncbi:MAG: response regulator, partial [Armatimonadetes bacterium]|nr:response regulator [Armatimonadota bacterium]
MEEKIKVLILEDLPSDAELAEREVKTVLKSYTALVTDTEQGFIQALETFKPDLIISDYSLPTFNGMKALQITREKGLSTPFIILTGSMNEDTAVDCMKAGADDYVIKEHIKRLGAAILNALDKKKKRQQRKQAMEEIEKLAKFPAENPNPVLRISKDGTVLYHNKGSELLLDQWHCQDGQKLPDIWSKLVIESIQDNEIKSADVEIADTVFSLTFAPIIEKDFVNVYG